MTRSDCVLIQQASGEHRRLLALTQHLHNQYCERHQIDYWCFFGCPVDIGDRAPNWPRVRLMQQAVEAGYRYVVWLDADCLIVDFDADLRDGCALPGFNMTWHDMSAFRAVGHKGMYDHWSTGAVYLNAADYGVGEMLTAWWNHSDEGHGWADQHALNLAVQKNAIYTPRRLDARWNSIYPHFMSAEPVVMAWHGYGDVDARYRAMAAEMEKLKTDALWPPSEGTPIAFQPLGETLDQFDARSEAFVKAREAADAGDAETAEAGLRDILAEKPDEPEVLRELAQIVGLGGDVVEAERLARLSVAYEPNVGGTWCMLGALAAGRGDYEEAGRCYDLALRFSPDMPLAHRNRALLRLMLGNYAEGFREDWEWGRVAKQRRLRFPASTEWQGQDVKRLLVWSDQGAGDVLMNWRFLRKLRERLPNAYIVWEVHDGLVGLATQETSVNRVVKLQLDGGMPCAFDAHVELGDLPLFLGLDSADDFRITEPYIAPDAAAVERWRPKIAGPGLKVGIAWAGNPNHPNDAARSMKLEQIAPLFGIRDVHYYTLMPGVKGKIGELAGVYSHHSHPEIRSWDDTAAIIELLDVVVTVDTGVAHLAGAMGQRVITLLPYAGDWRWGPKGEETHWYPSMTLLRQARLGDWSEPVCRAAAALEVMSHA